MAARSWYFAWLDDEAEPFDPIRHKRRDIGVKSISSVREEEGVEATSCALVTERMPAAQLAGKRWAMLSFELPDGTLVPVARMKRRPVPSRETEGELALDFDALPTDWMAKRDAGLIPLKVRPFFEPLFVSPTRQSDPTEILDGHRRVMHFDRVTHAFSTHEMLGVGLPRKVLRAKDLVGAKDGGGIRVRRTKQPLAGVQVQISVPWTQADDNVIDFSGAVKAAFPDGAVGDPASDGAPSGFIVVPGNIVSTCTPDALEGSYPKKGASLGGASGYTILEASLKRIPTPAGAPAVTGACRGSKARYNFVEDADLKKPINLGLQIAYYDPRLVLGYSLRQRREERLGFFVPNGNVAYADGAVETIVLRAQDPTIDGDTLPYTPNQNVQAGDQRRQGIYVWNCRRSHVTRGSFAQDLYAADGTPQWELLPTNGAPAGTSNLATWFGTRAGDAMCVAAGHKAVKKISLSQRCQEVRFVVPFEDWPDVSTGWVARLEVDDPQLPNGFAEGKVVAVEISQSGYPRAAVTILCCDGSGLAGPDQAHGINPTNELWDGITLSSPLGLPFPATPVPGGIVVAVNTPSGQVRYVQSNDFTGVAPRNDRTANDPKHLLGEVKTSLQIVCNPISGQPTLYNDIALVASAWNGPRQISDPTV